MPRPRSLDLLSRLAQCPDMSAADITREIGALPLEEQLKVIAFSKELDKNRELTHEEFLALAKKQRPLRALFRAERRLEADLLATDRNRAVR